MSADGFDPASAAEYAADGEKLRAEYEERLARRTYNPVHRGSRYSGMEVPEAMDWSERDAGIEALRRRGIQTKVKGKRRGQKDGGLSLLAEKIYAYLSWYAVECAGKVFPTYETIANDVGCSINSVWRCLAQLKAEKLLDWMRRCEPTGREGIRGPQIKQISNFYFVRLNKAAQILLAKWREHRAKRPRPAAPPGAATNLPHHPPGDPRASAVDAAIQAGAARAAKRNGRTRFS